MPAATGAVKRCKCCLQRNSGRLGEVNAKALGMNDHLESTPSPFTTSCIGTEFNIVLRTWGRKLSKIVFVSES